MLSHDVIRECTNLPSAKDNADQTWYCTSKLVVGEHILTVTA